MRFLFLRAGLLMFALGFTGLKDPYDLLACVADCVAGVWRGRGRALSLLRRDSSWVSMKIAIIFLSPSLLATQRGLCGGERIGVEGGTAVVIQLGLREYKSCSDDLHLTAPAKKIPGVLHWRKSGTYRLWGVRLFTAFHSHNITSSNKLVMSLFIENRVKGILKINSIITRTLSTGKGLLSLITFQALGFITF